jgi:hypothetical protein
MNDKKELLTYFIMNGIYKIHLDKAGYIGEILFHASLNQYVFIPIENFCYKAVHLVLIANKLNILNNYKKEVVKDE